MSYMYACVLFFFLFPIISRFLRGGNIASPGQKQNSHSAVVHLVSASLFLLAYSA